MKSIVIGSYENQIRINYGSGFNIFKMFRFEYRYFKFRFQTLVKILTTPVLGSFAPLLNVEANVLEQLSS